MANLNEYIYEEVLYEEMKLNKISNKLGKIILQLYNCFSKMENKEEHDKYLSLLKRMRVELLIVEKKYYAKEITSDKIKTYFTSYMRGLNKIKKELEKIDDKKIKYAVKKIDDLVEKMKEIKRML